RRQYSSWCTAPYRHRSRDGLPGSRHTVDAPVLEAHGPDDADQRSGQLHEERRHSRRLVDAADEPAAVAQQLDVVMPVGTPFHQRTFALCESLSYREWSGYFTVSAYETHHEHEYNAIRNAAALIDISPLFKYVVTGPDAARLIDR